MHAYFVTIRDLMLLRGLREAEQQKRWVTRDELVTLSGLGYDAVCDALQSLKEVVGDPLLIVSAASVPMGHLRIPLSPAEFIGITGEGLGLLHQAETLLEFGKLDGANDATEDRREWTMARLGDDNSPASRPLESRLVTDEPLAGTGEAVQIDGQGAMPLDRPE